VTLNQRVQGSSPCAPTNDPLKSLNISAWYGNDFLAVDKCPHSVRKGKPNLARKRPPSPVEWIEVRSDEGVLIGRYSIQGRMITVRHRTGGEKSTQVSGVGDNEGLARIILSEFPG
jgi:hypothetical protein